MIISLVILVIAELCCSTEIDSQGYVAYCPCLGRHGRFGNQADQFLGALAFSKGINRTLIVPPWIEFRDGERVKSIQVPYKTYFDIDTINRTLIVSPWLEYRHGKLRSVQVPYKTYFKVDTLSQYHRVITMEDFMSEIAPKYWPESKRIAFCYMHRSGEEENSCNAKSGNPFGPFWDTYTIHFVGSEFYGPLNFDADDKVMMEKWQQQYTPEKWPVLAFTEAPASFPVQNRNKILQRYVIWNEEFSEKTKSFIKENMSRGGYLAIHLRNGPDWANACKYVKDRPLLFAAPQCVGYKNERGPLTSAMCLPPKAEIVKQVKRALKKVNGLKYIFVATDSNDMIEELKAELQNSYVKIIRLHPSNPHLDLAIMGQANYFIGNCVSSFSAFVKRERDVKGLPSEFWAFPHSEKKHEEL